MKTPCTQTHSASDCRSCAHKRKSANPVYEPPTIRILARMLEEETAHVEKGLVLLGDLLDSPEKSRRAARWQGHLEELLAASGGVTGFPTEQEAPRKVGRS